MEYYQLASGAQKAWESWIAGTNWDLFWTVTDAGMSHPEHMSKRVRYITNNVNRHLYGGNWKRHTKGISTITGLERQGRGSIHAHMLLSFPDHDPNDPEIFNRREWQTWADGLGGFTRIEVPRSNDDVVSYVSKYVLKGGEILIGDGYQPNAPIHFSTNTLLH